MLGNHPHCGWAAQVQDTLQAGLALRDGRNAGSLSAHGLATARGRLLARRKLLASPLENNADTVSPVGPVSRLLAQPNPPAGVRPQLDVVHVVRTHGRARRSSKCSPARSDRRRTPCSISRRNTATGTSRPKMLTRPSTTSPGLDVYLDVIPLRFRVLHAYAPFPGRRKQVPFEHHIYRTERRGTSRSTNGWRTRPFIAALDVSFDVPDISTTGHPTRPVAAGRETLVARRDYGWRRPLLATPRRRWRAACSTSRAPFPPRPEACTPAPSAAAFAGTAALAGGLRWQGRRYTLIANPIAEGEERARLNADVGRCRVAAPELARSRYGKFVTDVSTSNER